LIISPIGFNSIIISDAIFNIEPSLFPFEAFSLEFLIGKNVRFHSLGVKGLFFGEVTNSEVVKCLGFEFYFEEVPLSVAY